MGMKDINFKEVLIQKGEQVALWVCVGLMTLFIIFGIFIKGLTSGSAAANAEKVGSLRKQGEDAIKNSRPDPSLGNIDPVLQNASNPKEIDPLDVVCSRDWFTTLGADDNKWRKPDVLGPDDFQIEVIRGLVRTFALDPDGKTVWVLKTQNVDKEKKDTTNRLIEESLKKNKKRKLYQPSPTGALPTAGPAGPTGSAARPGGPP